MFPHREVIVLAPPAYSHPGGTPRFGVLEGWKELGYIPLCISWTSVEAGCATAGDNYALDKARKLYYSDEGPWYQWLFRDLRVPFPEDGEVSVEAVVAKLDSLGIVHKGFDA